MSLKTIALAVIVLLLVAGFVKFLSYQKDKYSGSESYVEKSIKAVKKVEALKEEKAKSISEHEREIESW